MRHLAAFGRVAVTAVVVGSGLLAAPGPVAAECSYIPPLPKISLAIPTAHELFVGQVVATGTDSNGASTNQIFTVRIDEVLRGPAKVGDLRPFRYMEPNWPWAKSLDFPPFPSCAVFHGSAGETVAVALGARFPGGTLTFIDNKTWYQPPTIFNTMAIIGGSSREQYDSGGRQLFSLERLRELAGAFPPSTDTPDQPAPAVTRMSDVELAVLIVAGLLGGAGAWRRTRRTGAIRAGRFER